MYFALSLKSGEQIEASKANYAATRDLLLVCPECGEPVHFKNRQYPYNTDFFAHPKELPSIKLIKACSLRVEGGVFKLASQVFPTISQGQLVDKFQKEFCKELYESMGTHSKYLYEFIKASRFERLTKIDYQSLISTIRLKAPGDEILKKSLNDMETFSFREGIEEICLFLKSPYGVWVGNFLYQAAYFIACMLHPDTINKSLGKGTFVVKGSDVVFVLEKYRISRWKQFSAEIFRTNDKRNLAIFKIAATLVSFLVLKWRFWRYAPKLMAIADHAFERAELKLSAQRSSIDNRTQSKALIAGVNTNPKATTKNFDELSINKETESAGNRVTPSNTHPHWIDINAAATNYSTPLGRKWLAPDAQSAADKTESYVSSYKSNSPSSHQPSPRGGGANRLGEEIANAAPISPRTMTRTIPDFELNRHNTTPSISESSGTTWVATRIISETHEYHIDEKDKNRVRGLIAQTRTLRTPTTSLDTKNEVIFWSGQRNTIEAYFVAAYLRAPHSRYEFSDPRLHSKLEAWIKWSRTCT